jgi:excisionase family DNA binding protein
VEHLLSLKTIAARTETSVAFWRKAVGRGVLPAVKVGRALRVREDELERFLGSQLQPVSEDPR